MKLFIAISILLTSVFSFAQDEATVLELEQVRKKRAEQIALVEKSVPTLEKHPIEQIRALGHKSLDAAALFDDRVITILREAIKQSKLRDNSRETMRAVVMGQVKGKPAERLFQECPTCLNIAADIMRDEHALPSLLGILTRKNDLKNFGFIALGLFIFGIVLRWIFVNKEWGIFRRIMVSTIISIAISISTLGLFYYQFETEIGPSWKIIKNNL